MKSTHNINCDVEPATGEVTMQLSELVRLLQLTIDNLPDDDADAREVLENGILAVQHVASNLLFFHQAVQTED